MILRISIGAFLQNQDTKDAFESIREDRIFLRSSFEVHEGGIDQSIRFLGENPTPNLLIVESTADKDGMMNQLNGLADVCAPGTNVILIGAQNDVHLYRELIDVGIGDYLVSPVSADELKASITGLYDSVEADEAGRVIAFFGVSGGVGSSVLAQNTAYELMKEYDEEVILIDLDVTYGTVALVFNMQPRQTIVDALTSTAPLDEAVMDQYMVKFEEKLSIMPAPASLGTGYHIDGEALDKVLNLARGMADFVVLDVPHLWEAWVPEVLAGADDVVLVCKPDLTNLRNAKNLIEYLGPKRDTSAPTRLIFNQEGFAKKTDLGDKDFKTALAKEPALSVPFDPDAFGRALNNGETMSKASGKSKATKAIQDLAKMVAGRETEDEDGKKKGGFSLFKSKK